MTLFLLAFDTDYKASVIELVKAVKGVQFLDKPGANGTVKLEIKRPTLDEETTAIREIEDVPGVIDLRALRR